MTRDAVILAIDDDPGRYDYLRTLLADRSAEGGEGPRLVVATCRSCVEEHLPNAIAVLLDYDLDGFEECASCRGRIGVRDSTTYLDALVDRAVPVIVSSCSRPANRSHLHARLDAAGVRVAAIAADHLGVEREWLGLLWLWGVL